MATVAAAGLVISAIAVAASVAGTVVSSKQATSAGKRNAKIQEQAAEQARQNSLIDAEQQSKADRRLMAAQRARFGAAGVDIGSGSALDTLTRTTEEAEVDRQRILAGGGVQEARFKTTADSARLFGQAESTRAISTGIGGIIDNTGTAVNIYDRNYGN